MQEVVRFFMGSMQTEVFEWKTWIIGHAKWSWAGESTPFEKWVEPEMVENLNHCQFGTKSF
jgi:hypothetical protein